MPLINKLLILIQTMPYMHIYLMLFSFFLLFSVNTATGQDDVISAFQAKWDNSKPYMMSIADKMPATHYDYKPVARQMNFKEQLLHIRDNMLTLSYNYIAEESYNDTISNPQALTKAETIQKLSSAFDEVSEIVAEVEQEELRDKVDFFAGTKTKLQILNLIQDHVTHHRGQLIVYLNLQGIEPPEYVGW